MTRIDGAVETVSRDIHRWWGQLATASTKKQVRLLELIAVHAEHTVNQVREELEFECTLSIFNHHGVRAVNPFGALPASDGRVLVFNYTDSLGRYWNGTPMNRSFITREVVAHKGRWSKGEEGNA